MAVYTKISKDELNDFLKNYKIGKITKFFGIKEGIENTNYQVQTKKINLFSLFTKKGLIQKIFLFL